MGVFNFNPTIANGLTEEPIIIPFDTISKLDIFSDQEIDIIVVAPGGTVLNTTVYTLAASTQLEMPVDCILLYASNTSGSLASLTVKGIGENTAVVVDELSLVNKTWYAECDIKHFITGGSDNFNTEVFWDDTLKKAFNRITFLDNAQSGWFLFPIALPTTFRAFASTAFQLQAKSSDTSATYEVLGVIDNTSPIPVERGTGLPAAGNSATLETVTVANTVTALTAGTFSRGGVVYIKVQVSGDLNETVDVWNQIKVNIL